MKKLVKYRMVEGNPNEIDSNEILVEYDNSTGEIIALSKLDTDGTVKRFLWSADLFKSEFIEEQTVTLSSYEIGDTITPSTGKVGISKITFE